MSGRAVPGHIMHRLGWFRPTYFFTQVCGSECGDFSFDTHIVTALQNTITMNITTNIPILYAFKMVVANLRCHVQALFLSGVRLPMRSQADSFFKRKTHNTRVINAGTNVNVLSARSKCARHACLVFTNKPQRWGPDT